jgi:glutaminase
MGLNDYDGRTALHLAAAEGHHQCVAFLLDICHVDVEAADRFDEIMYLCLFDT